MDFGDLPEKVLEDLALVLRERSHQPVLRDDHRVTQVQVHLDAF